MIPNDRAFTGADLENFRQSLGLTVADICYLLGMNQNSWGETVNKDRLLPVKNPSIAILCRLIDQDESLLFIPKMVHPVTIYNLIKERRNISKANLSTLFGCSQTASTRWFSGKRASPAVEKLGIVISNMIKKNGVDASVNKLRDAVKIESVNRNIPDIFETNNWSSK